MVVELHLEREILLGEVWEDGARLLDLLNGSEASVTLWCAHAAPARDGAMRPLGGVAVPKAEILLAVPYDGRGLLPLALRRAWQPTDRARVVAAAGPLTIRGTLHGPLGAGDPLPAVLTGREQRAFLPLTDATVEHRDGWSMAHSALIVRHDAFSLATEAGMTFTGAATPAAEGR